ncbi:sulfite oxidase [Aestuariicoccus sp. MJ-SS9]|uniref:sulfite oxidase n=1 Tax=Aestuariicoccus sp. MJ-SS9 TaxID=3079855 RepID=UPI002909E94F|nr:sulfite oxidase [Aestuariicoccus sp. MJ-SS9]MDU8913161.1 sulfite oxidase [Aestuariicoccus sp. MJ-SS9]
MASVTDIFRNNPGKPKTVDGVYSEQEVRLANRNSGIILETLRHDVTPTGAHYLLTHFDVPALDEGSHRLTFGGGFEQPFDLSLDDIRALPQVTMPVTLECAGNGRARVSPRSHSMPWSVEAVGTSEWTGTPLRPLIERARPAQGTVDIVFTGADEGFDNGVRHFFGRSLTLDLIADLDVLLVHAMNGQPLLPQHGAPLRIVVPGWYGMASVKWLSRIEAIDTPYQGFQQVQTYRYRDHPEDEGRPVTAIRVKSLMIPPGIPDWLTRTRQVEPGSVEITGRAWAGKVPIARVEFGDGDTWQEAQLTPGSGPYAWSKWSVTWQATPGEHLLRCRATDAEGNTQPLEQRWDASGFGNNAAHCVAVFVPAEPA